MRARFSRLYVSSCWISTPTTSTLTRRLSLFESFQRWPLHEHGREDPPARRLHHRLHHRVGSGGSSDPQQPVSLPPGEPATSVKIWDTQTGERGIAHHLFFFKYTMSLKSWIKCERGAFFSQVFLLYFILQITLSYGMFENKSNIINLKGVFPVEEDPSRWEIVLYLKAWSPFQHFSANLTPPPSSLSSRFKSVHCLLYPVTPWCPPQVAF